MSTHNRDPSFRMFVMSAKLKASLLSLDMIWSKYLEST